MMPREGLGIRKSLGGSNLNWFVGILSSQVFFKSRLKKASCWGENLNKVFQVKRKTMNMLNDKLMFDVDGDANGHDAADDSGGEGDY